MNYPRNIRRASIGKRVLISWVVIAISFFLMGLGIGAICARGASKEIQISECPENEKRLCDAARDYLGYL